MNQSIFLLIKFLYVFIDIDKFSYNIFINYLLIFTQYSFYTALFLLVNKNLILDIKLSKLESIINY